MNITGNHVSRRLRSVALASFDEKCRILALWAHKGIPLQATDPPALEWFPTSLRSFCKWDGSQNAVALRSQFDGIHRNAYESLAADSERLQCAKNAIKLAREQAERTRRRLNPKVAVEEAKERAEDERARRRGALLGYRRARQQARELNAKLLDEQRAHRETMAQLQSQLQARDAEIIALRRQVSELTATLQKTTPLRQVK